MAILGILTILLAGIFGPPGFAGLRRHPERSFESQRKEQRKIVQDRIATAGGWAALRGDCERWVTNLQGNYFVWSSHGTMAYVFESSNSVTIRDYSTNVDSGFLPPAVAALQPHFIEFQVSAAGPTVVPMQLFGMHRTGMWDIPYYGIWVVCGPAPSDYTPTRSDGQGPAHTFIQIAPGVFEAYE